MSLPESGTIAIRAEKPSVARDIARVLGATNEGESYLHGNGYVVAWACRPLGECTPELALLDIGPGKSVTSSGGKPLMIRSNG